MKLSLAWIFDHIKGRWSDCNVQDIVRLLNEKTAEVEGCHQIKYDLTEIFLVQVSAIEGNRVIVTIPELSREFVLPMRSDMRIEGWFFGTCHGDACEWTTVREFGSEKDGIVAAVSADSLINGANGLTGSLSGKWRELFEQGDYVFEIDNKTITHRPDLWGHRGFAREIAAFLGQDMIPIESLITPFSDKVVLDSGSISSPITLAISEPRVCSRLAGVYIPQARIIPSQIAMVQRLCRVDSKPINGIVDGTNYAMLDLGYPMHAFDAHKLHDNQITVRFARAGEKLTVLDGDTLTLSTEDIVIADARGPISLTGVTGGKESGISDTTTSLFIEAGCFDATTIRRTSVRHAKRTDASARFEKGLDQQQVPIVLGRYVRLMQDSGAIPEQSYQLITTGSDVPDRTIALSHDFIERRLGVSISPVFIEDTLRRIGFTVKSIILDTLTLDKSALDSTIFKEREEQEDKKKKKDIEVRKDIEDKKFISYEIRVPSFRSQKDIISPEDIIEEIGRFFGYRSIPFILPRMSRGAALDGSSSKSPNTMSGVLSMREIERVHEIKQLLAHGHGMRELYNYPLYDEQLLQSVGYEPTNFVSLANPISEHRRRLVTSLIPHLVAAVANNSPHHTQLRFFEWGRVWQLEGDSVIEKEQLSGILFHKRDPIDFYQGKQVLSNIDRLCKRLVTWERLDTVDEPWHTPYQTANLMLSGKQIGVAGTVPQTWLSQITEGHAFIFTLDGNALREHNEELLKFVPLAKYPEIERDISMFVPLSMTVDNLCDMVNGIDERIVNVCLVDFFQKKEWKDQRAVTIRFVSRDAQGTLTHQEVDEIQTRVVSVLIGQGIVIR